MSGPRPSAPRRSPRRGPRLAHVVARHTLCAVGLLLLCACQGYAAQITLAWDDPNNNPATIAGYRLYYWQAPGQTLASVDVGTQTTYTLTGLTAGQTYDFAVTAYTSTAESADSNVVNVAFPPAGQTGYLTFIYPTNGAQNIATTEPFQWSAVSGALAYYLYVGTAPGLKDLVNTGEMPQTSYQVAALPSGQPLYGRIWTKTSTGWFYADSSFTAQ